MKGLSMTGLALILSLAVTGCELSRREASGAPDRVTVDFNCGPGGERPARLVLTRPDQVAKARAAISVMPAPFYKCGYTGGMSFYRQGKEVLAGVEFNLHEECRHAVYVSGKTVVSRKLTDEGLEFLKGLKRWACAEKAP